MPLIALLALAVIIGYWAFFKWVFLAFVLLIIAGVVKELLHPESAPYVSPTPAKPSPKRQGRVVFTKQVRQVRNGKVVIIRPKHAKVLRFYVDE